jgi:(2Fe-2S) ferredoxin
MAKKCTKLLVCTKGKRCAIAGGPSVLEKLRKIIDKCELNEVFKVKRSGCLGHCKFSPVIEVKTYGFYYAKVQEGDCIDIIERHLKKKKPLKRLLLKK